VGTLGGRGAPRRGRAGARDSADAVKRAAGVRTRAAGPRVVGAGPPNPRRCCSRAAGLSGDCRPSPAAPASESADTAACRSPGREWAQARHRWIRSVYFAAVEPWDGMASATLRAGSSPRIQSRREDSYYLMRSQYRGASRCLEIDLSVTSKVWGGLRYKSKEGSRNALATTGRSHGPSVYLTKGRRMSCRPTSTSHRASLETRDPRGCDPARPRLGSH
jgi:hypothetical protein